MESQTTVIEVNGVKLEVDLRNAKRIDTLRIGDRVKCLVKQYSDMKTCPGVVVGFEPFKSLPSIVVAYLDNGYNSGTLKFQTFNSATKDFEIIADIDNNALEVDRASILQTFDRETRELQEKIRQLEEKRDFFLANFGKYFTPSVIPETA